jgi:Carboxypeptidase regulatory-like domain
VGTLAGIISIGGAAFSVVHAGRAANMGNLVAIVKAESGRLSLPDATIEVVTTANAVVATLTPDPTGRATRELPEGIYIVRITHPQCAADVRHIQVLARQTVEIRATLRAASSRTDHTVGNAVSAIKKALRF